MNTRSFFLQGLPTSSLHPPDLSWHLHWPHVHPEPCTASHLGHPAGVLDLLTRVHKPEELLPDVLSVQLLLQENSQHGSHSPEDGLFVLERDGRDPASKTEGLPFLQRRLSLFPPLSHTPTLSRRWAHSGGQGGFPHTLIPSSPCHSAVTCSCSLAQSHFRALCRASPLPLITPRLSAHWAPTELLTWVPPLPSWVGSAARLTSSSWQSCQFLSTEKSSS